MYFFLKDVLLIGQLHSSCRHFPRGAAFVSASGDAASPTSYRNREIAPPIEFLRCNYRCHGSQSRAGKHSSGLNSLLFVYRFAARARGEAAVSANVSIKPSYSARNRTKTLPGYYYRQAGGREPGGCHRRGPGAWSLLCGAGCELNGSRRLVFAVKKCEAPAPLWTELIK